MGTDENAPVVASVATALVLRVRIPAEDTALAEACGECDDTTCPG